MVVQKQKGSNANIVLVIKHLGTALCSALVNLLDRLQTMDADVVADAELAAEEEVTEAEAVLLLDSSQLPHNLLLPAQLVVVTIPNLGMG